VSATLIDTISGLPLSGKPVSFAVGTETTSGTTNTSGVASSTISIDQAPAGVAVGASFVGDATYVASSALDSFTITREETSLAYGGPSVILAGTSGATVTARLVEDGANDTDGDSGSAAPSPAGQTITFAIGSDTCSDTTNASGVATCTIANVSGASLGPKALETSFAGDAYYLDSSDSDQVIVFAFPSRGVFVLGNTTVATATPTTTVSWWSDSWWQLNRVSGGTAPSAFKGFAGTVTSLPTQSPASVCGTQFVTTTGNSPPPAAGVPSYMGVIVASSVTKNGSAINGVWGKIVVVRTNPGYAPTPSTPGTGTIVATFCG
jgi:hypothetical protein